MPVPGTTSTVLPRICTSSDTPVAFAGSAIFYVKTNGKVRAHACFSKPEDQVVLGELYIFAYDFNGTPFAYPVNPEKLNETAGNVGLFHRNMSAAARNGKRILTV